MLDARLAALAVEDADTHLNELAEALRQSTLYSDERTNLLVRAWEAAVEGTLEDGLLSFDEENALARYLNHFGIDQRHAKPERGPDQHGQGRGHPGVDRGRRAPEAEHGGTAAVQPDEVRKTLVWTMGGVDYLEVVAHRERRGSSQGLNVRVARRLYYRPSTFRSRSVESEETVHQDTGPLGIHHQAPLLLRAEEEVPGPVRQDRELRALLRRPGYHAGTPRTAKPQSFVTGDGWFAYNLAANLAQFPGLSRGIPAPPEIQQQGRGGCGSSKVTWPQQLLRTSRPACQGR